MWRFISPLMYTNTEYNGYYPVGQNWVGGIHFVKKHPLFDGLPVNDAMNWPYQAVVRNGDQRFSFHIKGEETVVGTYRSWPFYLGSAVGVLPCGKGKIVYSTLDVVDNLDNPSGPAEVARKLLCNFIKYHTIDNEKNTANSQHGQSDEWTGDVKPIKNVSGELEVPLIAIPAEYRFFDGEKNAVSISKDYSPIKQGVLWCAFLAEKIKGSSRMGLSFENKGKECLFVPIETGKPHLTVVRIEYDTNKVYFYQNISPASIPDLENAEKIIEGDFSFDKITVVAEKGCVGKLADLHVSDNFHEAVVPRTLVAEAEEGTSQRVKSWKKRNNALWLQTTGGTLYLQPYQLGGIRVMFGSENEILNEKSYAVTEQPAVVDFTVSETPDNIMLSTSLFTATVNKEAGYITYNDKNGKTLVKEMPGKARKNVCNDSVNAYCAFELTSTEALYGLGQYRDGRMNLRNCKRELVQFNTQSAVPNIFSTAGWGLFWNNPSRSVYTDDEEGLKFISDYGKVVDYYLFIGDDMDNLIGSYRALTGQMPMLPYWALGFHQSRNRYHTDKDVIEVAHRMNKEQIPMSTIFIDYHHWGKYGTGSFRFDERFFPNVSQMLDSLHRAYDTRVVLTVWPSFKPGISNYNDMYSKDYLLKGAMAIDGIIYDPFNPDAAKMYSEKFSELLKYDIDGWFLDGPEPDHVGSFLSTQTYLGAAHKVRNIYPLFHTADFYQNLMKARPGIRPYLLTRCAWSGQQKYGATVWSGDIPATFDELALQVAAGLNFTASGIPYWTTDIGGYSGGNVTDENYRELFTRWFQYGTFCPIFRSHGRRYPGDTKAPNELWSYGEKVQKTCSDYIKLRYKLLPYIYSLTGKVTHSHYTPMRLLAFDFSNDEKVLDCKDQFMFGTAFLVCPVVKAGAVSRPVYLPKGHRWIDFWTNRTFPGGSELVADAPIEQMPLYVKAGSIIPSHSSAETQVNPNVPLEIDIYSGEDGEFELYEDDGTSMDYQSGVYRKISLRWIDKENTLYMEAARGNFKADQRTWVIRLKGLDGKKDRIKKVTYKGKNGKIRF